MRTEAWETGGFVRWRPWLRALGMALVALPCLAAAGTVGYRVAKWQGDSERARAIALSDIDDKRRMAAMVGAFNDAFATVEMLKLLARSDGVTGRRARTLLRYLHEASK